MRSWLSSSQRPTSRIAFNTTTTWENNKLIFNTYVQECKQRALYDTGIDAEYGDKLITLSTCEYSSDNGRLIVVAKKD